MLDNARMQLKAKERHDRVWTTTPLVHLRCERLAIGRRGQRRGEPAWTTHLFVKPVMVDRWLALLGRTTVLFVELRECKIGRDRWVRSIALHTADPTEE